MSILTLKKIANAVETSVILLVLIKLIIFSWLILFTTNQPNEETTEKANQSQYSKGISFYILSSITISTKLFPSPRHGMDTSKYALVCTTITTKGLTMCTVALPMHVPPIIGKNLHHPTMKSHKNLSRANQHKPHKSPFLSLYKGAFRVNWLMSMRALDESIQISSCLAA